MIQPSTTQRLYERRRRSDPASVALAWILSGIFVCTMVIAGLMVLSEIRHHRAAADQPSRDQFMTMLDRLDAVETGDEHGLREQRQHMRDIAEAYYDAIE